MAIYAIPQCSLSSIHRLASSQALSRLNAQKPDPVPVAVCTYIPLLFSTEKGGGVGRN